MKIKPNKKAGGHKTGTLNNVTVEEINAVLGFKPNVDDDPDKVVNSWGFTVSSVPSPTLAIRLPGGRLKVGRKKSVDCGIWDYKGSQLYNSFSTYGPDEVFKKLFGSHYSSDRF